MFADCSALFDDISPMVFGVESSVEIQMHALNFFSMSGCLGEAWQLLAYVADHSPNHWHWRCPGDAQGGGPRVVVSTAAFHARVQGSVPGLGGLKETKMFLPHPRVKVSIVGSLRDREVACSASDRQGSNFESCVWRTVSSQSSYHPQEVLLAQFSPYVHKGGLKPDSFHFISFHFWRCPNVCIVRASRGLKSLVGP